MVKQHEWLDICRLIKSGLSVPEVSHRVGRSTTTIYRLLNNGGPKSVEKDNNSFSKYPHKYKDYLDRQFKSGVSNAKKLYSELQIQGYKGTYSEVNKYLNLQGRNSRSSSYKHFFVKTLSTSQYKPSIRFETQPGEQAQVDWGHFGKIEINGRIEKLSCFVYVLGYSRMMYVEFTVKQTLQTLEQCHIHAFEALGMPKTIVYDNMKTVVKKRERSVNNNSHIYLNPAFLDFAQYYGFKVQPCPPYWPRAKGKVEAGVKYVRNNFMQGMKFKKGFISLEDLNLKAAVWLRTIANIRIHKTTNEKPTSRWITEKNFLYFPKNVPLYTTSPFVVRNSTKDGLIQYKSNFYSVPIQYARKKLLLKEVNTNGVMTIAIYHEDKIIAQHKLSAQRGQWIIEDKHLINDASKHKIKRDKKRTSNKSAKNPSSAIGIRSLSYYDQFILGENNG